MFVLIKRNLCLYFREMSNVMLSILSVFIVIGVYILFLSRMQIDMVQEAVKTINIPQKDIMWLVNSWVLAGMLAITPITSSLGGLGILIYDLDDGITKDFKTTPVGKVKYPVSVLLSGCIIGFCMSLIPLVVYDIYIYAATGHLFTADQIMSSIMLLLLTSVFSSSIMGVITSFIKNRSSFTTLSIIVGTLIGFLDGVYMPIGMLHEGVQTLIKILPFGSPAMLFRNIIMSDAINGVMGKIPNCCPAN